MRSIRAFLFRVMALFRRGALERQMNAELQAHLDELIERNLRSGMKAEDASRSARLAFGGFAQVQEKARDERKFLAFEHLRQDLRHAVRQLRKTPWFSGVIIGSLAIGVAANTTIFSWINTVLFHPLPGVARSASLQMLEPRSESNLFPAWSWLEYGELRERLPAMTDLVAFRMVPLNVGEPGRDERVYAQLVSDNYFDALNLKPLAGGVFHATDPAGRATEPVAVISYGFWQSYFGGRADVVGKTLRANNRLLTVVGVAPRAFRGTVLALSFDVWVPASLAPTLLDGSQELESRAFRGYNVLGFLAPGATSSRAQHELDLATRELARLYPETNRGLMGELHPFTRPVRGPQRMLVNGLFILQAVTLLVLLVVCANTANLLLARATARRREIGVRLALGAAPARIVSLLLVESLVLAGIGAVLGTALAYWGTEALRALPNYGALPIRFESPLDAGALGFALILALGCGVVFGLAPALQLARTDPHDAFRAGLRSAGRDGFRSFLVGMEACVAVVALTIAAFFIRNFTNTQETETGYAREGVLLAAYDLSGRGYDPERARSVTLGMLDQLRALPQVESAAIASTVPMDIHGLPSRTFTIEGRERVRDGADDALSYQITPEYFRVMGIHFSAGHDLDAFDGSKVRAQAIVNEEFARRYLGNGVVLGRGVLVGSRRYEVVGVVRNALYEAFGEPAKPVLYLSYVDRSMLMGQIHLRSRGSETSLGPELRQIVRGIDPAVQVYDVRTLGEHIDRNLLFRRVPARIFSVLGPLILLLAAIGIYAVAAYAVAQRTVEIGVRRALGAPERAVVAEILRRGMKSVVIGTMAGTFLALVIKLHLRGVAAGPAIMLGVPTLLVTVAALACWIPARRAARVDPMVALRHE